jgi:hypothetical protein
MLEQGPLRRMTEPELCIEACVMSYGECHKVVQGKGCHHCVEDCRAEEMFSASGRSGCVANDEECDACRERHCYETDYFILFLSYLIVC